MKSGDCPTLAVTRTHTAETDPPFRSAGPPWPFSVTAPERTFRQPTNPAAHSARPHTKTAHGGAGLRPIGGAPRSRCRNHVRTSDPSTIPKRSAGLYTTVAVFRNDRSVNHHTRLPTRRGHTPKRRTVAPDYDSAERSKEYGFIFLRKPGCHQSKANPTNQQPIPFARDSRSHMPPNRPSFRKAALHGHTGKAATTSILPKPSATGSWSRTSPAAPHQASWHHQQ